VRYHYLDEGPRDGPPVVMLHGNPTWSFYYRTLIPGISESYRVVVPDHVGCGLSDKPQDYDYTLEQHIQNVEALIGRLGLKDVTLAVHDWGGVIGMGYATRHVENVARFVIFNTAAFAASPCWATCCCGG
jgi:pimeloyl-ACP methyl ester carboxylesterase